MLVVSGQAHAQEVPPTIEPYVPPMSLPSAIRLEGISPVYQDLNRCSAAALTIQLSYFDWSGSYDDTIRGLNPHIEDVAVRLEEMARFAEAQGLRAIIRIGGTLDLLKALVANGFPVLVENVYYEGGDVSRNWLSHNRVIMGYDDAQGALLSFDPLLGHGEGNLGRPILYTDVDRRWRDFNRDYLILYRPEDEERLIQVMAALWDETYAYETALAQSMAELDTPYSDSFTLFNIGDALTRLGRYQEAAEYFDRARQTGLPWRMFWYIYTPFEAYYQMGRYADMLDMARSVIQDTPGVEEMYYYAGLAYEAQGDLERAKANYEVALMRNSFYTEAVQALGRVTVAGG